MQQTILAPDTADEALLTPQQALLTDDSEEILRFAVDAFGAGMETALVTLTGIRGGAARAAGAQMVVREDGGYCGFVSGGCVESAAAFEAMAAIACVEDRVVRYGEGSPWFDIVLPCGGGITLHIHPLRSAQPLLAVLNLLAQRQPAALRYHPAREQLECVTDVTQSGWEEEIFTVAYRPRVRVMVFGRSIEAQATVSLARASGYDVQLVETLTDCAQIDAQTAVILLSHDLHRELPVLQAALRAQPFYIGALGSYRTHQKRTQKLSEIGFAPSDIARIKAPIGIFPKARDARSLALSVLADVAAAQLAADES
ncbi:XdhC family protein [Kosakonia cowanii]|uniref:XdhC family protein n=1 Tax=Kosakonia cowanii TaxID=208223 RepID=UPI0025A9A5B0|nr:XdhC family protein [Kosakonia cowanii]MDM9617824.1 XdhC family protein [Kosakonia cowanii]MDP4562851.1 XdhC family protein [Kosakonia cowanii]